MYFVAGGIMRIIIDNGQALIEVTKKIENIIKKSINGTLKSESFKKRAEVAVILVDNNEIQEINKDYRKIDKPTDVLSFPMLDFNIESDDLYDYDRGYLMLGDIVISMEKAMEQSIEYGHSFEREIGFLCVHSTLHLLGYDHDTEDNTIIMRQKEETVLESLNLRR